MPTPIELYEPAEFNRSEGNLHELLYTNFYIEEVRAQKERDYKRREEDNLDYPKKGNILDNQARSAKQNQEMKNKNFTYNFDGSMLMVQQPKIEKLPNQAYVVK